MPEILIDRVLGPLSLASNPEWPGDSELTLRLVSPCLPGGGSRRDGLQGRKQLPSPASQCKGFRSELPLVVRALGPPKSSVLCSLNSCLYFTGGFRPCNFSACAEQPLRFCSPR